MSDATRNPIMDDVSFIPANRDFSYQRRTTLPDVQWRSLGPTTRPLFWARQRIRMQAAISAWREAA